MLDAFKQVNKMYIITFIQSFQSLLRKAFELVRRKWKISNFAAIISVSHATVYTSDDAILQFG